MCAALHISGHLVITGLLVLVKAIIATGVLAPPLPHRWIEASSPAALLSPRLGAPTLPPLLPPHKGSPSSTPLPTPQLGASPPASLPPRPRPRLGAPPRTPILPPSRLIAPPPKPPPMPPRTRAPPFTPPLPSTRLGPTFPTPRIPPPQLGAPPKTPTLPPPRRDIPPSNPSLSPPQFVAPPRKGVPPPIPLPSPRLGAPLPSPLPPPWLGAPLPGPHPSPHLGAPLPPPRLGAPLPNPIISPPPPPRPPPVVAPIGPKVPALFAFGDSIVDTGNNNYLPTMAKANFPPYGRDYAGHKATGRFSDGKITVDFLASALGLKETVPPFLNKNLTLEDIKTGVSFASAGSGYSNATCRTSSTMTIERQLQLFAEYKAKVGTIPDRALFVVCSGSNDIVEHFTMADGMTSPEYADMMARRAISLVEALIAEGARQILLAGAPPVGCVPAQRRIAGGVQKQCATDRNQLALMFNRKLSQEVAKLAARYRGVNVFFADLYSILANVVERYQALGFKNGKDSCCGYVGLAVGPLCNMGTRVCPDPAQYVFWDSFHPTERAYKIMVDDVASRYFRYIH